MALTQVITTGLASDAVTGALIADDAIGSEHIEVLDAALQLADDVKIQVGTGNDLEIYHDGTNSWVSNVSGDIEISNIHNNSDDIWIRTTDDFGIQVNKNENAIICTANGSVELYYDNSLKFKTNNGGGIYYGTLNTADDGKATYGSSDDLQIYHTGGENFIRGNSSASRLYIDCCEELHIRHLDTDGSNSENMIKAKGDGAVELYYDNTKKFETGSGGISVTGGINLTTNLSLLDNGIAKFGTGDDLQIFHDGSHSRINATDGGTGRLIISGKDGSAGDPGLQLNAEDSKESIMCDVDGAVRIFHNGTLKVSTQAGGLCFNADTAAANALDDYEEGTYTPAVEAGASNTQTFNAQGRYTKIGRQVYCQFLLQWSGQGDGNQIKFNMPFTCVNNGSLGGGVCLWTNIPTLSGHDSIVLAVQANTDDIACHHGMDSQTVTSSSFTNSAFYGVFQYEAA